MTLAARGHRSPALSRGSRRADSIKVSATVGIFVAIVAVMAAASVTGSAKIASLGFTAALLFSVARLLRSWRGLTALLLFVIFFIPIKRYDFPVQLPLDIEPYRIVVAILGIIWIAALLLDPKLKLRRSGLELPLVVFFSILLVSDSVNFRLIAYLAVTTYVIKTLSFFASFALVYFIVFSVTRTRHDLEFLVKILVGSGSAVAVSGIVEYRTGYNVFNHLSTVAPILRFQGDLALSELLRSSQLRVYASAQHPIAYAAVLVMLLPLGIYLALSTGRMRWWCCSFLLGIGSLAALSRTAVLMFVAAAIVLWRVRPVETKRLLPLMVPAFLAVFLVLPHSLGALKSQFFPKGGIIADQQQSGSLGNGHSSGRLATLGPGLKTWEKRPIAGQGFGTRVIDPSNPQISNSSILDDQWLGLLIETGVVGVGALIWLFVRSFRRLRDVARRIDSRDGLLAGALAASIVSYGVGMLTLDTFDFIQVTFLFFITLALGASLLVVTGSGPGARGGSTERLPDPPG